MRPRTTHPYDSWRHHLWYQGQLQAALLSVNHDTPYYDYELAAGVGALAFLGEGNIAIMVVYTCPITLTLDARAFFGGLLQKHVFRSRIAVGSQERCAILKKGHLMPRFDYLKKLRRR